MAPRLLRDLVQWNGDEDLMTKTEKTLRQKITARFREMDEGLREYKLTDLVKAITTELARDPKFARQFVETMAYTMVYAVCIDVISKGRGGRIGDLVFTPRMANDAKLIPVFARWGTHREHIGDKYVLLVDLTKAMGRQVIAERQKGVETELRYIKLIERLTRPLKSNQTIKSKWSPKDIHHIWTELEEEERKAAA